MNKDFLITKIDNVIFVSKEEYQETKTVFSDNPMVHHELIFHLSGKCCIKFNGHTFNCSENTIRFLPKCKNEEYIVEREEHGDCIDVFFDTDLPISDEAFILNLNNNANIASLFKKLFSIWVSKGEGYYFECISLLYKILAEMQKQNYLPQSQYDTIKPAIEYIHENFLNVKITIPHLADKCSISEAYLKKLFIKKFGVSPIKYIIQLKTNHACDLLRSHRYSVNQVAEICGYDNVYYFSRQFKEYVGISPTEFKSKYKSSK